MGFRIFFKFIVSVNFLYSDNENGTNTDVNLEQINELDVEGELKQQCNGNVGK